MPMRIDAFENVAPEAASLSKPTQVSLIGLIRAAFDGFPDGRRPSNATKYEMADAALSAFSVFFSQSPLFLDWQIQMEHAHPRHE